MSEFGKDIPNALNYGGTREPRANDRIVFTWRDEPDGCCLYAGSLFLGIVLRSPSLKGPQWLARLVARRGNEHVAYVNNEARARTELEAAALAALMEKANG